MRTGVRARNSGKKILLIAWYKRCTLKLPNSTVYLGAYMRRIAIYSDITLIAHYIQEQLC